MDITINRLYNQHLLGEKFATVSDAISYLGAVQAQDYPAARWALGLRIKNSADADIPQFTMNTLSPTVIEVQS